MMNHRRERSRSPHHDEIRPTLTRDYNHGMGPPRDDDEIDIFAKGLADIEKRRRYRHGQSRQDGQGRRGENWERKSGDDLEFRQNYEQRQRHAKPSYHDPAPMPFQHYHDDGYHNDGTRDYRHDANTYYHDDDHDDRSYCHDDKQRGYDNDSEHFYGNDHHSDEELAEDSYIEAAAKFGEELDYLDGNAKNEKSYRGMGYSCEVCNVEVTSVQALQTHFAGAKHKKHLAKKGLSDSLDPLVKPPEDKSVCESIMKCTLCNVILQGSEINVHSKSMRHKEVLTQMRGNNRFKGETQWYEPVYTMEEADTSIEISENRFECKLCAVILPKEELFKAHLNGKKHQKKLRWKHISEDDGGNEEAQYWCSLCKIFCTTSEILDQHFAGKQHARMLRMKGVSENEIKEGMEESAKAFPDSTSNGLFGSLPEIAAAQRQASSFGHSNIQPTSSTYKYTPYQYPSQAFPQSASTSYGFQSQTSSGEGTSKPASQANTPNPISVGAFLQSIGGEDPLAKKVYKPEPKIIERKTLPEKKCESAVDQFLSKISYGFSSMRVPQAPPPSIPPPTQPATTSLVQQLAAKKHFKSSSKFPKLVQYPTPRPTPSLKKVRCTVCHVILSTDKEVSQHLATDKHQTSVRENSKTQTIGQLFVPVD